jgi:hypothetical protein
VWSAHSWHTSPTTILPPNRQQGGKKKLRTIADGAVNFEITAKIR